MYTVEEGKVKKIMYREKWKTTRIDIDVRGMKGGWMYMFSHSGSDRDSQTLITLGVVVSRLRKTLAVSREQLFELSSLETECSHRLPCRRGHVSSECLTLDPRWTWLTQQSSRFELVQSDSIHPNPIEILTIRDFRMVPAGGKGGRAEKGDFLLRFYFNLSLFSLQSCGDLLSPLQ